MNTRRELELHEDAERYCHECGKPLSKDDGTNIFTTLTDDHSVKIVGLSLCDEHKDDKLAVNKCIWAIQRATGK